MAKFTPAPHPCQSPWLLCAHPCLRPWLLALLCLKGGPRLEYAAAQYLDWNCGLSRGSRWEAAKPVKPSSTTEYLLRRIPHVDQGSPDMFLL